LSIKWTRTGQNKDKVINEIKKQLDDRCIEFSEENPEEFFDRLAMCDEMIMETYLEKGRVETSQISAAVKERKVFPCFFGSALKLEGVEEFIHGLMKYTVVPSYPNEFGAKIFKITRDEQGTVLPHEADRRETQGKRCFDKRRVGRKSESNPHLLRRKI